jgi:hypothetical protein
MQGCIHEKSYKKTILKKIDVYKIKKKTTDELYVPKHKPKIYLKKYTQIMHFFKLKN